MLLVYPKSVRDTIPGHILRMIRKELEDGFDWVIVVDAPHDVCVARVMERSKSTAAEVERRMTEQLAMEEKRGMADFVIENGTTITDLERATAMVAMIIEAFPDPEQ
jgi:dephospho-CoA kinase